MYHLVSHPMGLSRVTIPLQARMSHHEPSGGNQVLALKEGREDGCWESAVATKGRHSSYVNVDQCCPGRVAALVGASS